MRTPVRWADLPSLLVTNDFPPKVGGIQSYLWELWRRLPPADTTVLTHRHPGSAVWDAEQPFRIERTTGPVLLPTPGLAAHVDALAREVRADVIFVDPWLPLGALVPRLCAAPCVVVVHGAEVTVPAHLPGSRVIGVRVLDAAAGVVAAGRYVADQAVRLASPGLRGLIVAPGVDPRRFAPLGPAERVAARDSSVSRPRAPWCSVCLDSSLARGSTGSSTPSRSDHVT